MTVEEFVNLVKRMRLAQKRYFKTRDRDDLDASRQAEAAVDEALAAGGPTGGQRQGDLFGGQGQGPYGGAK